MEKQSFSESEWFDAIVVGGGPAGSTAGRHLASKGLKTLIIDKSEFPREKPCGNLISGAALKYLDLDIPKEIIRGRCIGGDLYLPGSKHVVFRVPFQVAIYVYRTDFDFFLLESAKKAGARTLCGEKIAAIKRSRDGVEVRMASGKRFIGEILIGADGATGMTANLVRGHKFRRFELGIAVYTMYPKASPGGEKYEDDLLMLDLRVIPGGYAWVFPQGAYHNIGIGGPVAILDAPRKQLREVLEKFGLKSEDQFRSHPLPAGGIPRRLALGRMVLVGDAAGFVDPLSGDGISFSILSGVLAADAAHTALRSGSPARVAKIYTRLARKRILGDLRAALFYNVVLFIFKSLFRRIKPEYSEIIFKKHFEAIAGKSNYRKFVRWALPRIPIFFARGMFRD